MRNGEKKCYRLVQRGVLKIPSYNLTNLETGETKVEFMWVSELETFLKDNPSWTVTPPDTNAVVDPWRMGRTKPADGFREILRGIKRHYKGSTVED